MSNLLQHAKRELELIGETDEQFKNMIMNVVGAFAAYGHSGGSASVAIPMINNLLQFKNLTPLTNDPHEWVNVDSKLWQNSRNPEAFSTDGGKTYYLLSEVTSETTKYITYTSKEK